jgi:hypothetical protein
MDESIATREDYPKGTIKDYLELLMLGKNSINKELIAHVMKKLPDTQDILSQWFLEEIKAGLENISSAILEEEIDFGRDDIVELIKKIQSGEENDNIILGDN